MRSKQSPPTPPNVNVGDVIRVHIPPLPDLWKVDEILRHDPSGEYLLRISKDSGKFSRTIAPRGFEVVSRADVPLSTEITDLRARLADARRRVERLEAQEPRP